MPKPHHSIKLAHTFSNIATIYFFIKVCDLDQSYTEI